jgi:hypothetical protein
MYWEGTKWPLCKGNCKMQQDSVFIKQKLHIKYRLQKPKGMYSHI